MKIREMLDRLDEISRRDFLKGVGATAGLAATGSAFGQSAEEKAKADQLARLKAASAAEYARADQLARFKATSDRPEITSTGPGPGYADKVRQKIKPHIVFDPNSVQGNPANVVLVDVNPDGTILRRTLITPSGEPSWDRVVLTAIDRAKSLPLGDDGKMPFRQIRLTFKPKD